MRWQRRLRPRRPACSHRSGGRRLRGRGGGVGGWDSRGGRRPGDAPDRARLGAGGNVLGRLGRAHAPPGLGCARPTAGPRAGSPGRRRRKSSRDVRFPGKWAGGAGQRGRNDCRLVHAHHSHNTMDPELRAAARTSRLRTGNRLRPSGHAFTLVGSPAALHSGELPVELWAPPSRGCSRRKGREER